MFRVQRDGESSAAQRQALILLNIGISGCTVFMLSENYCVFPVLEQALQLRRCTVVKMSGGETCKKSLGLVDAEHYW